MEESELESVTVLSVLGEKMAPSSLQSSMPDRPGEAARSGVEIARSLAPASESDLFAPS